MLKQDDDLWEPSNTKNVMEIHDLTSLLLMMTIDDPISQRISKQEDGMSSSSPASSESDGSRTDTSEGESIRHFIKELTKKRKQKKQKKKKKGKKKSKEKEEEEEDKDTLKDVEKNRRMKRTQKPQAGKQADTAKQKDKSNVSPTKETMDEEMKESIDQEEEEPGGSTTLPHTDDGDVEEDEVVEIDREVEIIEKDIDGVNKEDLLEGTENSEPQTTIKGERKETKANAEDKPTKTYGGKGAEADDGTDTELGKKEVSPRKERGRSNGEEDDKGSQTRRQEERSTRERKVSGNKKTEVDTEVTGRRESEKDRTQTEASRTIRRLGEEDKEKEVSPRKERGRSNGEEDDKGSQTRRQEERSTRERKVSGNKKTEVDTEVTGRRESEKDRTQTEASRTIRRLGEEDKEDKPQRKRRSSVISGTKERESEPGKEKKDRKQREESPTRRRLSPSTYKRRQKGEEEDKPQTKGRISDTSGSRTLQLQTTDEDRMFFEKRTPYETADTMVQLEERVPTVELTGRDIHGDMTKIRQFMRKSYFSLERVANITDRRQRMCSYWNLGNCTVGQTTHTSGSFHVAHFCVACHAAANVQLGHPAVKCPNVNFNFKV